MEAHWGSCHNPSHYPRLPNRGVHQQVMMQFRICAEQSTRLWSEMLEISGEIHKQSLSSRQGLTSMADTLLLAWGGRP
jgi:hypothetical protein